MRTARLNRRLRRSKRRLTTSLLSARVNGSRRTAETARRADVAVFARTFGEGVAELGKAAETTPPGTEALGRVFQAAGGTVLILLDEVLNSKRSRCSWTTRASVTTGYLRRLEGQSDTSWAKWQRRSGSELTAG